MMAPPKKAFGQNFLTDEETARTVVRSTGLGPGSFVVEVGPGRGFLTRFLLDSGANVVAVEKDPDLPETLREQFFERPFTVIQGDMLDVDLASLAPSPYVLVGNLPYYVSLAILAKALDAPPGVISQMVFMFQKEVALRLCASPTQDAYGIPSILCAVTHQARLIRKVPAGAFFPKPKVDSALVHLAPLAQPLLDHQTRTPFLDWAGSVFRYRRKTVRNAVSQAIARPGFLLDDLLARTGIPASARPEDLPITQLIDLWRGLKQQTADPLN